jgi:hypothetical protein
LTTPRTLRELRSQEETSLAAAQVEVLKQQVLAIQEFDSADFDDLAKLARAIGDGADGKATAADLPPVPLTADDAR